MKKHLSLLLFICLNISVFSQENKSSTKEISGTITYLNAPLPNVNIILKGTTIGTKTNTQGNYTIKVKIGDILQYSYVGFNTVSIIVEDVTEVLDIEMKDKTNVLDEVIVTAKINKISQIIEESEKPFYTAVGVFNPKAPGSSLIYLDGKDISPISSSQFEALKRMLVIWDVDRIIYKENPPIDPINIKSIYMVRNIGSMRWGGKGVIIVRTKNGSFKDIKEKRKQNAEQYRNQNYYNDDAVAVQNETTFSSNTITAQNTKAITKNIHGTVTYIDSPLANVNIIIVGKTTGAKTNAKGLYTIKADVGDIIQYSHLGFATVSIIIEDVTEILDIEMVIKENKLAEVTVIADGNIGKVLENAKKANETFETSMGTFDPKRSGAAMAFIDGEKLSNIYSSIGEALDGKISGVRYDYKNKRLIVKPPSSINTPVYPIWDIDGVIYDDEPPMMNLDNVKSIRILKTLAGTNRYGNAGAGGVIVIQTKTRDFNPDKAKRKKIAEQYTNKNYYSNDASVVNQDNLNSNSFADALEAFNSKQKAYLYYDQTLKKMVNSYSDYISIAQKFVTHYKDIYLAKQVLNDLAFINTKNAEILKAIAYQFQALGLKRETIKTYKNIFKLRPKYAQSYRDLANAYLENDQYKKAWRMYMSYLMQGNDVSGEGIGQILYNEMEFLYYNRRNQADIKETFIPKSDNLFDFRNDVRLVFEWNTSEAEFDLEFVNQEKRAYLFEHSLAANQDLITDEKQKGYSSKEFFIDDIGIGEWLVNITYKGNKKPEPTYFKVTQYFNWGKANQTKKITIYKFQNEREKIQLIKLNKQVLVASN